MMRNSINSYLTTLVMVLALLLSANAFATETVQSTIEIGGEEYNLYTGFTATAGTHSSGTNNDYSKIVDGIVDVPDATYTWHILESNSEEWTNSGYAYIEFSSDVPIVLKGYILNTYKYSNFNASDRRLYAKANEEDAYELVSSYTNDKYSEIEKYFSVDNEDNNQYRYFRFEGTNSNKNLLLSEIRLYGEKEFYSFLPQKSATCTETGIKQACYLRGDGRYFTDETGTKELSKEDVVEPRKPHDLIHHDEDAVHSEYWQCSVCGRFFSDGEGRLEILYDATFIHRYIVYDDRIMFFILSDDSFKAIAGDIFTFKLDDKYLDVRVSDGINDLPITSKGNGVYSFTVPAANVTISAEIKPEYRGRTLFEIGEVDKPVSQVMISSGVSTVKLKAGTNYCINDANNNRFGVRTENADYSYDIPFVGAEGEFYPVIYHYSLIAKKDGWYDISLNEVGDGKWNLSIVETEPQIEIISDQIYTGKAITPKPAVTLGTFDIAEGTDYEYSYTNNINVGTATVTVMFKGDYAEFGSVSKSFNITKATPTVIPPTSADPKYVSACVALVTAGSTDFGTMLYSVLREGGSRTAYSTYIPCADRAGNYTVYYKVEESDNWFGVEEQSVDVTVELAKFIVAFENAEGNVFSSKEYEYGTPAEGVELPPENPEKADDEMYAYTFAGWSPQIQEVTGAMTYSPIYDKTRIGFGSATIAADGSWAIIDGKSSKKIDADLDAVEITGDVTLNREFVAKKPSTIVLPFGTHIDNVPGFTFYSFKGVVKENGVWKKVVFDEVDKEGDGHIYANTPYIVVAKEDVGGLIVENGVVFDLNSVRPMSSEDGIWQFVGTYDFKVWNEGDRDIGRSYGFAAEERDGARIGQFVMLGSNAYAYPMRAYLRYAGGNSGESRSMAPALFKAAPAVASIDELPESMDVVIRGEEGTTVIGSINTRTGEFRSAENRWFDLNGRFLGNKKPTVKGTYYNNGKKVIVK